MREIDDKLDFMATKQQVPAKNSWITFHSNVKEIIIIITYFCIFIIFSESFWMLLM